jgi:glycosyltransferase involved in cell wall biosynthesis
MNNAVPTHIVPMGAWLDRIPTVPDDGFRRRRVVYLGHLVPRQGVAMLLDALSLLRRRSALIEADIIGDGPLLEGLRARALRLDLGDHVRFHGFIKDHRRVEEILAGASIAVAPYAPDPDSITRYADPGKLKAYVAAGLPVVLTRVPPLAVELAEIGGAVLVPFEADALADAIERGLDPAAWKQRRDAALAYASRFDWTDLLDELFSALRLPRDAPQSHDARGLRQ